MPLYIFEDTNEIRVTNVDPNSQEAVDNYEAVLRESFVVKSDFPPTMPMDTKLGIIRNILSTGGAMVLIV